MDNSELQKIKQRYNIVGNSDGLNRACLLYTSDAADEL